MSSEPHCFYHPDRKAITSCSQCQRPICPEDRRWVEKEVAWSNYNISSKPALCYMCYDSQKKPESKPISTSGSIILSFAIIAFIFGIFYFSGILGWLSSLFGGFGGLFYFPFASSQSNSSSPSNAGGTPTNLLIFEGVFVIFVFVVIFGTIYIKLHDRAKRVQQISQMNENNYFASLNQSSAPLQNQQIEGSSGTTCKRCGSFINPGDPFCPSCGTRINDGNQ